MGAKIQLFQEKLSNNFAELKRSCTFAALLRSTTLLETKERW